MKTFDIPSFGVFKIENLVFDYNGTLALDGYISDKTKADLLVLCNTFNVYIVTADTFGLARKELENLPLDIKILRTSKEDLEKLEFLKCIGYENTIAIGNGSNDTQMLSNAAIGICILGKEGCSTKALSASDIVVNSIDDAISVILNEKRMIATLRY